MSDRKLVCISEGKSIIITSGYVQFPDRSTIPTSFGNYLMDELAKLLNREKSIKIVWEQVAHIIGYDVHRFLDYRIKPWRCGAHSSQGRTIYFNNQLCGMMDTPELAARVVAALNEGEP